jgi:hypothetical protein
MRSDVRGRSDVLQQNPSGEGATRQRTHGRGASARCMSAHARRVFLALQRLAPVSY